MKLEFTAKTNKTYVMINTAVFHLKTGGTITIDRNTTEYDIEDGKLSMTWRDIYIWEINGENVCNEPIYPSENLIRLLEGAKVELILEDDADHDYEVESVKWTIS